MSSRLSSLMFGFAAMIATLLAPLHLASANKLDGRYITFKKVFDGWWDVVCDTATDGTDARCYVQYVDPYRPPPKLRAAMVDFVYRKGTGGRSEPVITFDIEPDLSWAGDVKMLIEKKDGTRRLTTVKHCQAAKCVYNGKAAQDLLAAWASARSLRLIIKERNGDLVERNWPLGSMADILRTIATQRRLRDLP